MERPFRQKVGRFGSILAMTRLNELLGMLHIACDDTRILQGVSDDSRKVKKDWLFVCRKGLPTMALLI